MRVSLTLFLTTLLFTAFSQSTDFGKMLVEAINTVSAETRTDCIAKSFSKNALTTPGINPITDMIKRLHSEYAPLAYHHSEINEFKKPDGTVYVMHIYARKEGEVMYKDFQVYMDPNPPHQLEKIAFIAEVAEPVNLPNGSIEQPSTLEWLTGYADKLRSENDLFGSFLIVKGSQTLFDKQFGYENLEKNILITRNTKFNMASGGKMFTAVSIAQLVEGGFIDYEDPVTKYVSGFSDKDKADKIKIRHLLSHTSGVSEYWSGQTNQAVLSATTIDQHLKIVLEAGFDFEASKEYRYCNSNYILLGAIIEDVTKRSFYDYVSDNIFSRAGMLHTGYYNHGSTEVAIAYARDNQSNSWKEGKHGMKGSSAGGAYSTVEDILKFSQALRNNTLIRRETLADMTSVKNQGLDTHETYGYGFMLSGLGGDPSYGHGGTSDGVNFEFRYFTRQNVTLIMFCNQNNGSFDDLKKNVIKLISGHR